MRRLLVTLLVAPMLSALVLVSTETAAHACTCKAAGLGAQVRNAEVVFVGTVSEVERTAGSTSSGSASDGTGDGAGDRASDGAGDGAGSSSSAVPADPGSGGTTTAVIEVESVYKGSANARERVTSPSGSQSCGVTLVADERFLIIGDRQDDSVQTITCDGSTPADAQTVARVARATGNQGLPPDETTAPTSARITRIDETGPPTFTRVAAPGAALVIVGFLGLVLARRRRTRA